MATDQLRIKERTFVTIMIGCVDIRKEFGSAVRCYCHIALFIVSSTIVISNEAIDNLGT